MMRIATIQPTVPDSINVERYKKLKYQPDCVRNYPGSCPLSVYLTTYSPSASNLDNSSGTSSVCNVA